MRAALLLPASMATVLESGRADRDRDPMAAVSQLARFDPIASAIQRPHKSVEVDVKR